MAIQSLFDPKRREGVRKAVRDGTSLPGLRPAEPLSEPKQSDNDSEPATLGKIPNFRNALAYMTDPPRFLIRGIEYTATELLILAIRYNDTDAAKIALDAGAEYDSIYRRFPPDPGDQFPEYCPVEFITTTPLQDSYLLDDPRIKWLIEAKREEDKARNG